MLTENLQAILATVEGLNSTGNRYISDQEIAERLSMPVQHVRDYLDVLEEEGCVKLAKAFGDVCSALITSRGRLELRDPDAVKKEALPAPITLLGSFDNVILNIDSSLTNSSQVIDNRSADPAATQEIKQLIEELKDSLKQVPPEHAQDAEAVARAAELLIDAATKQKPNKVTVAISKEGLQKAAQNLASIMPTVLAIATQIVTTLEKWC